MNKKIIFITIIIFFYINILSFSNNTYNFTNEEKKWINDNNPIVFSPDPNYKPIEFYDKNGNFSGITADYIKWINDNTELEIKIQRSKDWSEVINKLKNKKIDFATLAISNLSLSEKVHYTETFLSLENIIVGNNTLEKGITIKDLKNKKIGVLKNYTIDEYIKTNYPKIEIIEVSSILEGLKLTQIGYTDAFLGDIAQISNELDNIDLNNLKYINNANYRYDLSFAVREDYSILASILNKSINKIPDKYKKETNDKWINIKSIQLEKQKKFILKTSYVISFLIFFIIIINIYLSYKIKTKTKKLNKTNEDLKNLNENLNSIIEKRTEKLSKALNNLIATKDNLVESEKMNSLNEIVVGLSHELNSPISNIKTIVNFMDMSNKSFIKKLNEKNIDINQVIDYCNQINENIRLLSSSINKTDKLNSNLNIFKLQSEKNHENLVTLKSLISELKKHYSFKYRNIKMNIDISISEDVSRLKVSRNKLEYILKELVNNSLFHGYLKNEVYNVFLKFTIIDNKLKITVKDLGRGIDKEILNNIFDPFFTTTRRRGSIGLGLFIVYNIVNSMYDGKINVYSSSKGTIFKIIIPIKNFLK